MSYILDALRKSEQQRQATQPDSATDRILLNPPQPKQKSTKWIIALIIGNLLVVAYFVWHFTQKSSVESQPKYKATGSLDTPLLPLTSEKRVLPLGSPASQNGINQAVNPSPQQAAPRPPSPSIAELIESKKMAEIERPVKKAPEKKWPTTNKEPISRSKALPASQPEFSIADEEPMSPSKPLLAPKGGSVHDFNELPYEERSTLPNLTINVFSYAQQPEDRFVIIDMVKYKTGQLIKGSVKLKEIRADSIILENGNDTFKVDRP
jgi:general secretion pathway protein B